MSGIISAAVVTGYVADRGARRAADVARDSNDAQLQYLAASEQKARDEANRLYPEAEEARNQGYQRSMDFLSGAQQPIMNAMQDGNVGAQNVLAGAAPQMQNAILGGPVDYSFMQPQRLDFGLQDMLSGVPTLYEEPAQQTGGMGPAFTTPYRGTSPTWGNMFQALSGDPSGGGRLPDNISGVGRFNMTGDPSYFQNINSRIR